METLTFRLTFSELFLTAEKFAGVLKTSTLESCLFESATHVFFFCFLFFVQSSQYKNTRLYSLLFSSSLSSFSYDISLELSRGQKKACVIRSRFTKKPDACAFSSQGLFFKNSTRNIVKSRSSFLFATA